MRRVALAFVLLFSALTAPAAVEAQSSAEQQLEAIREAIFTARFTEAVTQAEQLLERDDLSAVQRNAGLEVLAVAQIANRQRDEATETLRRLYSRDPGHRLTDPDASPPVISAFALAREAEPEPVTVTLEHRAPTLTRRESPTIEVDVAQNEDAVAEVHLIYRAGGEGPATVTMSRRDDGTYVARVPVVGEGSTATEVAYHVVALAPSSASLAAIGSADEPLRLSIPAQSEAGSAVGHTSLPPQPADEPSVAEQWWFWTLIGVLVVGGAVTAGILLGPAQEGPEQGSLGTVRLMQLEF